MSFRQKLCPTGTICRRILSWRGECTAAIYHNLRRCQYGRVCTSYPLQYTYNTVVLPPLYHQPGRHKTLGSILSHVSGCMAAVTCNRSHLREVHNLGRILSQAESCGGYEECVSTPHIMQHILPSPSKETELTAANHEVRLG